jgi:hypothetical protein
MSFRLSFHQPLLRPTGAHLPDDPPDLSCQDSTCQHAVDSWPLSCNLLPCQERPTTPMRSHRCPAAASAWSPITARPARPTAPSRSRGAARGGRRTAAATGSRPARAISRHRTRAAALPLSLAAGCSGGVGTRSCAYGGPHRRSVRWLLSLTIGRRTLGCTSASAARWRLPTALAAESP